MAENMIKFLRGNVANLPANATAGAVYFTKDEGLYLGLEDGTYHRYGDFIIVDDVASLPEAGAHEACMYYCTAENVLAKWDGTKWVQINKQKTLAELGGVAKSVYEAKIAALEKADSDNATAIANLDKKVGIIPNGEDGQPVAESVIAYINKKTDGIATSGNLEALGARVTTAEGEIDALQEALAEGGETSKAIGDAQAAADAAQDAVDTLAGKVGEVAEGKTVVGLIDEAKQAGVDAKALAETKTTMAEVEAKNYATKEEAKGYADAKDEAIGNAQAKADEAYNLANGKATMEQVNSAIAGAGHAVKSEVDTAIENLGKAYVAADTALETKLQGNIDKKVDQTAYDTKVGELAGEDARLAGLISDMDTAYKAADTALDTRVGALEGTITGLSGAMHFKGVKTEIPADVTGYADGDVIIVGDKEYVFNGGAFVEFGDVSAEGERIAALEGIVGKEAEGEAAATGLVKAVADNTAAIATEKGRAEAKEAELAQADATNLQAAKDYADDAVEALNIAQYAKQADVDTAIANVNTEAANKDAVVLAEAQKGINAVQTNLDEHEADAVAHITAAERTAWNAAEQNAKDFATGLNNAMDARVDALEAIDHEHANKAELDKIADGDVAKWNGAQAAAEATAAAALADAKTELEGKITAEANTARAAEKANADAIGIINGADTVDGSIAKALKDAKAYADTAESDAVTTANAYTDSALQWGSF